MHLGNTQLCPSCRTSGRMPPALPSIKDTRSICAILLQQQLNCSCLGLRLTVQEGTSVGTKAPHFHLACRSSPPPSTPTSAPADAAIASMLRILPLRYLTAALFAVYDWLRKFSERCRSFCSLPSTQQPIIRDMVARTLKGHVPGQSVKRCYIIYVASS